MIEGVQRKDKENEGKTKIIYRTSDPDLVEVESKDDLTAGNGKKHDVLPGKGAWSTATTCNIFNFLKKCGIPVAFEEQIGRTRFLAKKCRMILLEVVIRREAHGSYLLRNPYLKQGHLFPQLICEFYLKTSGKKWNKYELPCDDPIIVFTKDKAQLFLPDKPFWIQEKPFLEITMEEFAISVANVGELDLIEGYARLTFLALEKAWQLLNQKLVDYKVEFGLSNGKIMLADVIDSDSWRKIKDGKYSDKQIYRDGGPMSEVAEKFCEAAVLTGRFQIPRQQIVIWRDSSDKDEISVIKNALELEDYCSGIQVTPITCSAHRDPVMANHYLNQAIQDIPDSVLIAYIGKSNGAGPTLSATCTVPVITVPATFKELPESVWSSLDTPSKVPVMTVLDPRNAALAALQILAARNPNIYSHLRLAQEKRLRNVAIIGVDC